MFFVNVNNILEVENENQVYYDKRVVVETVMETASNYVLAKAQTTETNTPSNFQ